MFGRRRDEDYDAYNEKYSSKYDDDYIAPSEEYRSECEHSHEQTYDDITDFKECDHDHEQTYNDVDREQRLYDNYVSLESRFEKLLMPNEHLLWAGGKDNLNQKNSSSKAGSAMLILSIIFMCTVVLAVVGIIMLVVSIMMLSGSTAGLYGITDKRLIMINNSGQTFIPLEDITRVSSVAGANGKGYITMYLTKPMRGGSSRSSNIIGMYNISDAKRVERILNDAIHGALMNK